MKRLAPFILSLFAPVAMAQVCLPGEVPVDPAPPPVLQDGSCSATGASLGAAARAYAASCSAPRVDCDPNSDGRTWTCASYRIGLYAPGQRRPAPPPVVPPEPSDRPTPRPGWADSYSAGGECWIDSTFDHGAGDLVVNTPAGPKTVRQIAEDMGPGPGAAGNPIYNDVQCGNGPANSAGDEDPDQCPGRVDLGVAGCTVKGPLWNFERIYGSSQPTSNLRLQAEDLPLGEGWVVEAQRPGFEGRGYAVWRGPGQGGGPFHVGGTPGANGQTVLAFDVPAAGRYRVALRGTAFDAPRNDLANDSWIRPPGGEWTKIFTTGLTDWAVGTTADPPSGKVPFDVVLPAGRVELGLAGRSNGHGVDWIELRPLDVSGPATPSPTSGEDLISIHYDNSYDWDDTQATVSAKHILDTVPNRDFVVVASTKSDENPGVIPGSVEHTRRVFPDAIDALDSSARDRVATLWQLTLEGGGTVHVAEGGPSDFTADVLRILQQRGVGNLKRVRVVQHSAGSGAFNERKTSAANLALVKSVATYTPIANGNAGGNGTADLNQQNTGFEARARSGRYGDLWASAFGFVPGDTSRRVDFSDTVELLHILGLPNDGGVIDFANRFMR